MYRPGRIAALLCYSFSSLTSALSPNNISAQYALSFTAGNTVSPPDPFDTEVDKYQFRFHKYRDLYMVERDVVAQQFDCLWTFSRDVSINISSGQLHANPHPLITPSISFFLFLSHHLKTLTLKPQSLYVSDLTWYPNNRYECDAQGVKLILVGDHEDPMTYVDVDNALLGIWYFVNMWHEGYEWVPTFDIMFVPEGGAPITGSLGPGA